LKTIKNRILLLNLTKHSTTDVLIGQIWSLTALHSTGFCTFDSFQWK